MCYYVFEYGCGIGFVQVILVVVSDLFFSWWQWQQLIEVGFLYYGVYEVVVDQVYVVDFVFGEGVEYDFDYIDQ